MIARLVVRLSPELASQRRHGRGRLADALASTLGAFDARLRGNESDETQTYRVVEGFDTERLDALRAALERLEGIEGAFVKPADEPP